MDRMTRDTDTAEEWIVVLEYQPGTGCPLIGCDTVHEMIEALRPWRPSALYSPDRYALQLHVPARRPSDALQSGLQLHDQAAATIGISPPRLVRTEVMTTGEFQRQWDDPDAAAAADAAAPAAVVRPGRVLTDDVYWATRALLRAQSREDLDDILTRFVAAAGGQVQDIAAVSADQVGFDISLDSAVSPEGDAGRYAVVERISVTAVVLEHTLATLVADARCVWSRMAASGHVAPRCCWRPARVRGSLEHMFDTHCLDCPTVVTFETRPGDAVCPSCGLRLYMTGEGQLGRYVADGWKPGGIQGYHRQES
jgi:hypothetical protein